MALAVFRVKRPPALCAFPTLRFGHLPAMPTKVRAPSASRPRDVLMMATPSQNADLRWFTGFRASDPFPAFSAHGRKVGLLPLLEVGRARAESSLDEVVDLSALIAELRRTNPAAGVPDAIVFAALARGVSRFTVPSDFPTGLFLRLKDLGLDLVPLGAQVTERGAPELFPARWIKSRAEVAGIRAGNRAACAGFTAVERVLAESSAGPRGALRWRGRAVTAELLKEEAQVAILRAGALCDIGLIIAPGDQAVDCHCSGSGPVRAGELIVCDIYPRHGESGQYGDMTRTYLKGRASAKQRRMVEAVLAAQRLALRRMRPGVKGSAVHEAVIGHFQKLRYRTGLVKGTYVGFFHGLGHGLGFDIHEPPALSRRWPHALRPGHVLTVEPGLYYPGIGGCRFEDVALITRGGLEMLSEHPCAWEIP